MPSTRFVATLALTLLAAPLAAAGAHAQACQNTGSFSAWLAGFRAEAARAGISEPTLRALDGITLSEDVIARDRRQGVFAQSFLEFSDRMVAQYRLDQGRQRLQRHADLFARIEQQYGVPGPVIASFWGLETDYGANIGDFSTLRALATLAYDCRRPERFRPQLLDALRIVERGDLAAAGMVGAWAGELGQTQFSPSDYLRSAVDYDGDGKHDLLHSVPDVLASSASLLVDHGWRRGEPWLEEVAVPAELPWQEADLAIRHSRAEWVRWGVTRPAGVPLTADSLPAALILPMGRLGPAFLAYPNFDVYLKWNQSSVYSTTAAYFATRLAGQPRVSRGRAEVTPLPIAEVRELQTLLAAAGFSVGNIDGVIGANTRAAVKAVQLRLGLPADSYPNAELLSHLRRGL